MFSLLNDLKEYYLKNLDKLKTREESLISAERIYNSRNNAIKAIEDGGFPFKDSFQKQE